MPEQSFNLDTKDDFVILSSKEFYNKVIVINGWIEDITLVSGTINREFRWSSDKSTYSQWTPLTLENLQTISFDKDKFFWIEFKYILVTQGFATIRSIKLDVDIYDEKLKGFVPFPIAYASEKGNKYSPLRIRPFSYNPYKQTPTIRLQRDLSYISNEMFGHEVSYFRSVPDLKTRDVILGEWTLYDVQEPLCLKVLVPSNSVPDSKFNYEMHGIDFEMPFEIHVDKRYWENIFGEGTLPQKRDILHMPLTNRIYEVNSSQIFKGLMNEPLYYKVDLKKYQPKSHVRQSEEIKDLLEPFTTGVEELFGEEMKLQKENVVASPHNILKSKQDDPMREYLNPAVMIKEEDLINNYTTISQFNYDLSKSFLVDELYTSAIRYKNNREWTIDKDRTYTAWFKELPLHSIQKAINTVTILEDVITVEFKYAMPRLREGQWLKIIDSTKPDLDIIGEIIYINYDPSELTVKIKIPVYLKNLASTNFPNWNLSTTLIGKQIARRNLLSGFDSKNLKGIMIDTFESKWFRLKLNNIEYWVSIPLELEDIFYGLIIGVSNKFKQISFHLYKTKENSNKTTVLDLLFKYIINDVESVERSTTTKYDVKNSMLQLTNIRLLEDVIEEEKHSLWLTQQIIEDSYQAIIVDNALPEMRLPYMGQIK